MKKTLLCGSALLLSLGLVKAQTPGAYTTYAYDDFQGAGYTPADALSINWFGGTWARTAGKLSTTASSGSASYYGVDFGTNTTVTPNVKLCLDLSSMADIQLDVQNASTTQLLEMRIVLEDFTGKQTQIEPNVSDCNLVSDDSTPLDAYGVFWPAGWNGGNPAVYPYPARNGFILPKNTRKMLRFDLSSVPGNIGGRTQGTYAAGNPATMPASSYDFDATKVHAILFIINEATVFNFTNGANEVNGTPDKGGYKYDTTAAAQSNYAGTINFYSFKIGSCLSALAADPNPPVTAVTDAVVNNSLKVYPNPAKEELNVSFDATTTSATISLSDIAGHTVYSTSASNGTNNITINTSAVPTGMYILNIVTANGVTARKVSIR